MAGKRGAKHGRKGGAAAKGGRQPLGASFPQTLGRPRALGGPCGPGGGLPNGQPTYPFYFSLIHIFIVLLFNYS
jgi:hypothetical protein